MFKSWCFAWLQSQKSVSSKTAADPSSRFCEFETVFQYRSRAKHWLKNLKILEVRAIFQCVFGIFKYNALSKRRLLLRKGFELIVCYLGSHQNSKYHLNILWRRAAHPTRDAVEFFPQNYHFLDSDRSATDFKVKEL